MNAVALHAPAHTAHSARATGLNRAALSVGLALVAWSRSRVAAAERRARLDREELAAGFAARRSAQLARAEREAAHARQMYNAVR